MQNTKNSFRLILCSFTLLISLSTFATHIDASGVMHKKALWAKNPQGFNSSAALNVCPPGQSGTPPNCVPVAGGACGAGFTGTPPNCIPAAGGTCGAGLTGTPPNCVAIINPPGSCPSGQTGTPPNCVSISVVNPTDPTCDPVFANCNPSQIDSTLEAIWARKAVPVRNDFNYNNSPVDRGQFSFNYVFRKNGAPLTAAPNRRVSFKFKYDGAVLAILSYNLGDQINPLWGVGANPIYKSGNASEIDAILKSINRVAGTQWSNRRGKVYPYSEIKQEPVSFTNGNGFNFDKKFWAMQTSRLNVAPNSKPKQLSIELSVSDDAGAHWSAVDVASMEKRYLQSAFGATNGTCHDNGRCVDRVYSDSETWPFKGGPVKAANSAQETSIHIAAGHPSVTVPFSSIPSWVMSFNYVYNPLGVITSPMVLQYGLDAFGKLSDSKMTIKVDNGPVQSLSNPGTDLFASHLSDHIYLLSQVTNGLKVVSTTGSIVVNGNQLKGSSQSIYNQVDSPAIKVGMASTAVMPASAVDPFAAPIDESSRKNELTVVAAVNKDYFLANGFSYVPGSAAIKIATKPNSNPAGPAYSTFPEPFAHDKNSYVNCPLGKISTNCIRKKNLPVEFNEDGVYDLKTSVKFNTNFGPFEMNYSGSLLIQSY